MKPRFELGDKLIKKSNKILNYFKSIYKWIPILKL